MAQQMGGLPDPAKINLYGAAQPDVEEYQKSLQDSIDALQQRYANPNWFNVAAGFFKPQLGGFAASLGSASQALGENLEKQRESQLPIAQMRSQLAMSKIAMGQNQKAADMVTEYQASGKPLTPAFVAKIVALAPESPVAKSLSAQMGTMQKESELRASGQASASAVQGLALQRIQAQLAAGAISRTEAAALIAKLPNMNPDFGASGVIAGATPGAIPGAAAPSGGGMAAPGVAPAGVAPAPPAGEAAPAPKKEAPIIITSPLGGQARISEADRAAQTTEREKDASARVAALAAGGGTEENYRPIDLALTTVDSLIRNNPAIAKTVMSAMAQGTLRSQIEAILQSGIGLSIQGIAGNIHVPVEVSKKAGWDDNQRAVADQIAANLAALSIAKQRMGGVNPNSARNAELGLYSDLTPSMGTTPNAALKALGHLRNDVDATRDAYRFVQDVYHGRHATITLDPTVPDKYSAILNHPTFSEVYKPYALKDRQLSEAYQQHINAKKKP